MLCGEYAVLHGATALVLPTHKGQSLKLNYIPDSSGLIWKSYNAQGDLWFEAEYSLPYLLELSSTDASVSVRLIRLLLNAKALNPLFLQNGGMEVKTFLEFDNDEGLGSSSTLTALIAQWAQVDPFKLHFNTFNGSGFDVAMAMQGVPLLYNLNQKNPVIERVKIPFSFTDKLWFIHLNKKQISSSSILKADRKFTTAQTVEVTRISKLLAVNTDYFEFCLLLELLENLTSEVLGLPTIKSQLFPDFKGTIKSLGAWGGDYILACSESAPDYFKSKGYERILSFKQMIKA